jgi:hypothetical protein
MKETYFIQVPICGEKSVQLVRVAFFRSDFLQNSYFHKKEGFLDQKGIKKPKMLNALMKVALHLVYSNSFFQKKIFELLHTILQRARNIKKIKTDELGINGPIL